MTMRNRETGRKDHLPPFETQAPARLDGGEKLAQAIILQAVEDYRHALKWLKRFPKHSKLLKRKNECEHFFNSEWFRVLTWAVPEKIIERIQREMNR